MSDGYARRRYRRRVFSENGEVARQRSSLLMIILAGSGMTGISVLFFALTQLW